MAKRRLNKKVALISSALLAIVILVVILVILHKTRDPKKFIKEGDAAVKAALTATDDETKLQDYKRAERYYLTARVRTKNDSLRIDVLFKLVDTYIQMDKYTETDQWRNVMACWNQIIRTDPENAKARFGRLKYFYIMADSGSNQLWQELREQASEFIEVAENLNLITEKPSEFEIYGMPKITISEQFLGSCLYLIRGRAGLELAKMGGVTDPDELLAQATEDLKKAQELEPENINSYWYLAQAAITKGEMLASRGDFEERDKSVEQARALLEQAVKVANNVPRAHINLLTLKYILAQQNNTEQLEELEPEYLLLVGKFPSSAEAFSALSRLYSDPRFGPKHLDKAINAAEEALRLDKNNVQYALSAANLHYRKFSYYGQEQEINKATEIAKNALLLPDTQTKVGPRNWANKINRASLYSFLAQWYIEQVLEPRKIKKEADTTVWLKNAEQAVYEIEQIFGSGEEPQVIKWRGMLELAKGNKELAIRKLYTVYEQYKASGRIDAQLSYTLAKIFKDTTEVGAEAEFMASALRGNIFLSKPEARLDYAEVLLKLRLWTIAISSIDAYEDGFGPNPRSQILRINAYIGAQQFDEAEEELAKLEPDDPNTTKLNLSLVESRIKQIKRAIVQKQSMDSAESILQEEMNIEEEADKPEASIQLMTKEINDYRQMAKDLIKKWLIIEPDSISHSYVTFLCDDYIIQGQINEAKDLVNQFLQHFPDNTVVLFYKNILSEPDPGEIPHQRRKEIEKYTLSNITDPARRAVELGLFYNNNNELEKATTEFKKALTMKAPQKDVTAVLTPEQEQEIEIKLIAANALSDIAIQTRNWELAEQVIKAAQSYNLDKGQGKIFAARFDIAKEDFNNAMTKLNEYIKQRPVFSRAYMFRSSVNAGLGNEHASIEDIRKASSLNPLDGSVAKASAIILFRRNQKLGDNVSPDQVTEAITAFERALLLNPNDLPLLEFYAQYISETAPLKALGIQQRLQKFAPSKDNALRMGKLSTKLAKEETNSKRKEALFAIADASFKQAMEMDPNDRETLLNYAEYYRTKGMVREAEKLLQRSEEKELLWYHYYQNGQYAEAKRILEKLYEINPKNSDILKGFILISEQTQDEEAAKRYSEELISVDGSSNNYLIQIQSLIKVGLIKEAELKLQSHQERFPGEPKAMLLKAWLIMKQGQPENALELINQALQRDQNDSEAWRLRGQVNLLLANHGEAIDDLKKSKLLSDDYETRLILAKAYLRIGQEDDAITELKTTINTSGSPMEARKLLERIFLRLGRKEELNRFYDETLEKFPNDVSWHNLAGAFAIAENDFEKAEKLYKKAYQLKQQEHIKEQLKIEETDNEYSISFDGYLQALVLGAGNINAIDSSWKPEKLHTVFEEGSKHIDGALAPISYYRMAEAKMKLGDETTAIDYCRKAVDKAEANETMASEIMLRMFLLLGPEEVSKYCRQKLAKNPNSLATNWTMFNLAKINTDYPGAIEYLNKCINIAGSDSIRGINYILKKAEILTLAFEKTSDNNYLKQAIADYESLLAKMPNNINVLNNLAYMLAENNERLPDALRYAEEAIEASSNNPTFLDTYAYVLYKNGKINEAAEAISASLQQYEQIGILAPAEVYLHSGMIREKIGAKNQALDAYKQALEVGADRLPSVTIEQIKEYIKNLSQ